VRTDVAMIAHINLPRLDNSSLHSAGSRARSMAIGSGEVCAPEPAVGGGARVDPEGELSTLWRCVGKSDGLTFRRVTN
jgi:hypothetical protein